MRKNLHPERGETRKTGDGIHPKQTATSRQNSGEITPKAAIEDVVMRQNTEFYQERILTYGSWQNFLEAHGLAVKKPKK